MPNLYQKNYPAENDYPDLSNHANCMAKVLTPGMYAAYRDITTPSGFTFDQVIQTGVDNPGCTDVLSAGCVAGDEECYSLFQSFFSAVIEKRHYGYKSHMAHHTDLTANKLNNGHLDSDYVLSCRIRAGRSIKGQPLPPSCTRAERREVERIVTEALATLGEHFKGIYHPLDTIDPAVKEQLLADHILFHKPTSPALLSSDIARDWPDARGIWHDECKDFVVWVNEEDHMRVLSLTKGGNMTAVFQRFCDGLAKIEAALKTKGNSFMWQDNLGCIVACPSNLGTGMRASVHVKLPNLGKDLRFSDILAKLRLHRCKMCLDTTTEGLYDISNADRLGYSEVDQVQFLVDGVRLLVEMEKKLEACERIDDLVPTEYKCTINGHTFNEICYQKEQELETEYQSANEIIPRDDSQHSVQAEETEV